MFIIIGANGQVGSELIAQLKQAGKKYQAFTSQELNITKLKEVENKLQAVYAENSRESALTLVNCAAMTDADAAEKNPRLAWDINFQGVVNLGNVCKDLSIRLLHISTDYVFAGTTPHIYEVTDGVNPIQVYGASKAAAELFLLSSIPQAVVLRTSLVFSGQNKRSDFIYRIKSKLSAGESIPMVTDQLASATYAKHLVNLIREVASKPEITGLLHAVNEGACSRYELAQVVASELGFSPDLITPVPFKSVTPIASRPQYTTLSTSSLTQHQLPLLPDWRAAVREAVQG